MDRRQRCKPALARAVFCTKSEKIYRAKALISVSFSKMNICIYTTDNFCAMMPSTNTSAEEGGGDVLWRVPNGGTPKV